MQAVIWLERYLATWSGTIVVVSHDRMFLDQVATDILHIHSRKVDSYRGNYTEYFHTMTEKLKNQQREYESQMEYRKHIQEFIDKFRYKASTIYFISGFVIAHVRYNAKRASLVQSRIKALEKLPVLEKVIIEPGVTLKFPEVEKMSGTILTLSEVSYRYSADSR